MSKWYDRVAGTPTQQPQLSNMNPIQRMGFIRQAMTNPGAFIQEQFPDVPENIRNNPYEVLEYLQRTRGDRFANDMQRVSGMSGRK